MSVKECAMEKVHARRWWRCAERLGWWSSSSFDDGMKVLDESDDDEEWWDDGDLKWIETHKEREEKQKNGNGTKRVSV